jgi:hypothetical protein
LCEAIQASAAASVSKLLTVVGLVSGIETLYAEAAGIEQNDFVDRLGMWMRSHVRLSIELVLANHTLPPIDHCFDMVLQDAAGFGERFHDGISAACAWICVAIGCEPDVLPHRIFVPRHCLLRQGETASR